jgi:hypothetical protein
VWSNRQSQGKARWFQRLTEFSGGTGGDSFVSSLPNREETGAFPVVDVGDNRVTFAGQLAPGQSAHFIVFVATDTNAPHLLTLRQIAIPSAASAPAMQNWALAVLMTLLVGLASLRLRSARRES